MKKTVINIAILIAVFTIAWYAKGAISPTVVDNTVTDTTYVPQIYEIEKIKEVEKPVKVVEYKRDTIEVEKVRLERDTVFVDTDLNTFSYDPQFLAQYPEAPKFLNLQFANDELELTYQTTDGNVRGKTWTAPQGYRVGLNNGQPNIETFADQPEDRLSYSAGVGMLYSYKGLSPYLTLNAEFLILGVKPTTNVYVGEQSFITAGINYEF